MQSGVTAGGAVVTVLLRALATKPDSTFKHSSNELKFPTCIIVGLAPVDDVTISTNQNTMLISKNTMLISSDFETVNLDQAPRRNFLRAGGNT
jgi:hypothetical protein